jgi:hypothetical protein
MFSSTRGILCTLLVTCSIISHAQIITDRPTQSFSPVIIPQGAFQVEAGFVSERPDSNEDFYNVTYTNLLLRYAVLEWAEIRLTQNYFGERGGVENVNGLSPTALGTKIHFNDEEGWIPQMGVIASYVLTNGDENFKPNDPVKDIRFSFMHNPSDRFTINYNVGAIWEGSQEATTLYTFMLGYTVSDRFWVFAEPYGFILRDTPADNRFNTGFTYLLNDQFQMDITFGNGLTERAPDYFVGFGIAGVF